MIDSETFFARYLSSPRLQQTQSDQRLISLNAAQIRLSPDKKIKSSFLQEEIPFQSKSTTLLSQTIKSLLKSSSDLVEVIKDKNLIDPQLQYHLRKFKNDHESVNEFLAKRVFDNLEQLTLFKEQTLQLQSEISNLNDKCKHRKECLKKLNDILDKKDKQILQLKSYQGLEAIFQALQEVDYYQVKLNQLSKQLNAEQIQEIIQKIRTTLTLDIENSKSLTSLQLKYNCEDLGGYIEQQFQLIETLTAEMDQMVGLKQQVQQCTELLEQQELEIEQLSQQLNENIKVVELTKAQLTEKGQQNDILSESCSQQRSEIIGMQVEINQYIKETEDLRSTMVQIQEDLEHQLCDCKQEKLLISQYLDESNQKLLHANSQNEEQIILIKQKVSENDHLKEIISVLQSNLSESTYKVEQVTQNAQAEIEELNQKIYKITKETTQIKDEKDFQLLSQLNQINQMQEEILQLKQHIKSQIQLQQDSNMFQKNEIDQFSSQIQTLQQIIKQQNEQIQSYVEKQNEHISKLAQQQEECIELKGKLEYQEKAQNLIQISSQDTKQKLIEAIEINQQYLMQLNTITQENDELKRDLKESQDNTSRLTQQIDQSSNQSQKQIEELNNNIIYLRQENKQLIENKESLLAKQGLQINQLEQEIQNLKQHVQQQECYITQKQESCIKKKKEIDECNTQIQTLQQIIKQQNEQIQQFVEKQSELVEQLGNQQTECSEIKGQFATTLQKQVQVFQEEINQLMKNYKETEMRNQKLQIQINESMSIIKQNEFEKKELKIVNETFTKQMQQLQQQYSALEQSYQQTENEKSQINQQLQENSHFLEQSMIQNENKFRKLKNKKQLLKEEINQIKNEKDHQYQIFQSQLNESNAIIKQREQEKNELKKANESFNQQIQQMQQQYSILEQSYQQIEQDKSQINQQLHDNSHLLEQSMIQNENKFQKLQFQNQALKEEIIQLKKNQYEKEHQFAQTVKQYHQKHQGKNVLYLEHNTKMSEINKLLKERNEDITKIKSQLEDSQIKSQLFRMKDETYRRVLGRIIKSIDPFFDTKGLTDIDNLLETTVEKVQFLIKQNKKEMIRNKENEEFSLNSQKELFNLELSQIAQN